MELYSEVKEIIVKLLAVDDEQITEDVHLQFDLGADSLGLMSLATAISKKYGIVLTPDDVIEMENVAELISFIESKIST